jgi:hypothetical protein
MALRACIREQLISPSIQTLIPDSLLRPVVHDGMFTLQQDASETIADFSLMRRYQVVPWEDTVLVQDVVVSSGTGGWRLTAYFGIVDKGQQTGFAPVVGTMLSQSAADSIAASCSKRFNELNVAIPAQGYVSSVSINPSSTGHLYIVKTSEGGYCALVLAGYYIGGIDRLHFYCRYTTENSFNTATGTSASHRRGPSMKSDFRVRHSASTDLRGRIIRSNGAVAASRNIIVNGRIEMTQHRGQCRRADPD